MKSSEEITAYWKQEYEKRSKELPMPASPMHELRQMPRLDIPAEKEVIIHFDSHVCPVLNVSIGGIAFMTTEPLQNHKHVELVIGFTLYSKLEILDSTLIESDTSHNEYKIRAKFIEGVNGYMIFVLLWDMAHDILNLDLVEEMVSSGATDDQIIYATGVDDTEYLYQKSNDAGLQAAIKRGKERQKLAD